MKVYISGPAANAIENMSIVSLYNKAEQELVEQGHNVINIMCFGDWYCYDTATQIPMRLSELAKADIVFVLPDWQSDNVAHIEIAAAIRSNKQIQFSKEAVKPRKIEFFIP